MLVVALPAPALALTPPPKPGLSWANEDGGALDISTAGEVAPLTTRLRSGVVDDGAGKTVDDMTEEYTTRDDAAGDNLLCVATGIVGRSGSSTSAGARADVGAVTEIDFPVYAKSTISSHSKIG